jgi:hypothetical protein
MNKPYEISPLEWDEIMSVPVVREIWNLDGDGTAEEFYQMVYGVKFQFVSGSPGYVGDLYILQGDVLTGDAPLILGWYDGTLQPVYD